MTKEKTSHIEVAERFWFDSDTYVISTKPTADSRGNVYHIDVEWHKDENKVVFIAVYESDNIVLDDGNIGDYLLPEERNEFLASMLEVVLERQPKEIYIVFSMIGTGGCFSEKVFTDKEAAEACYQKSRKAALGDDDIDEWADHNGKFFTTRGDLMLYGLVHGFAERNADRVYLVVSTEDRENSHPSVVVTIDDNLTRSKAAYGKVAREIEDVYAEAKTRWDNVYTSFKQADRRGSSCSTALDMEGNASGDHDRLMYATLRYITLVSDNK